MAVKIDLARKKVSLGVGDLVAEPMAGPGRVAGLRTWSRMALGREAHVSHQRAQASLQEGYVREIVVRYTTVVDEFKVTVQGRIDGVYQPHAGGNGHGGEWVIEEIKSVVLPPLAFAALNSQSHPHYVEQLRLYCFFALQDSVNSLEAAPRATKAPTRRLSRGAGGPAPSKQSAVIGRLVYVNVADGSSKVIDFRGPFDECEKLVADRVRMLISHAYEQERRCKTRRAQATELRFPHDKPRKHQDRMIGAVEKALVEGRHLMVSAPSGIGKTVAALYPAVRHALANDMRLFFVTAKNTQQAIALETLKRMGMWEHPSGHEGNLVAQGKALSQKTGVPTAVAFRAREQMCINDVYACHEEFCPHLRDFTAKLEQTRVVDRLLARRLVLPDAMIEAGKMTRLCPFELALLEAELTDVIVCDYNYVFDPQVYFRRFFQDADYSDAILIIDEAHNLLQRAMDYYSPSLRRQQIQELMDNLNHVEPSLANEFDRFLNELDGFFAGLANQPRAEAKSLMDSPRAFFEELKPAFTRLTIRYLLDKISRGRPVPDDPVEDFFSAFGQFQLVLAMEGEEFSYVFDATGGQSIKIVCKDPSRQLAQRIEGFHSVVAMSATLAPMGFYRQMLGFDPDRTDDITLPSPFPRENRKIIVEPTVSTTYRSRAAHYGRIADIIVTTAGARRGNYMALFPSYEFLQAVAKKLEGEAPAEPLIDGSARRESRPPPWQLVVQEPRMTGDQRQTLLESLRQPDSPKLVLAVQGGVFAEGVDYPGELLSGVIVVSPALPQVGFERELMRQYYDARYGKGFEFAYLYPGMNRVIQSVGRLIRTETDTGVAVLVCQRFAQQQYAMLFPPDWLDDAEEIPSSTGLAIALRRFWSGIERIQQD